jgi:pectate lyase
LEEDLARIKPIKRINSVAQQMIDDEAKQIKLNGSMNAALALAQNTNDGNLDDVGGVNDRKVKIKSVGDLVNFVVAKVDKREEKIIKVSKTDEGDNQITGINLGLFKFRKAEK